MLTVEKLYCMTLPADFTERIIDVYGDLGSAWLTRLPFLLDELSARWRLRRGEPYGIRTTSSCPWSASTDHSRS